MRKKIMISLAVILILAIAGGFYFYKKEVPKMAAKAIVKGEYSPLVPKKIQTKVNAARQEVNEKVEKTLIVSMSNDITIEQLFAAIDQVEKQEVEKVYDLIKEKNITDPQEAFKVAYDNIKIEAFDPLVLKPAYDDIIKKHHVLMGLNLIEKYNLFETLDVAMARSIAKQILLQKKEEIESRTDALNFK
ncbi:hypothetical protein [Fulvivirga sp.]|uniref:hypothetical protein n=1 Tax=Fulvivirga sp. TaxID=1931237 RepID=UPI0032ED58BD